MKLAEVKQWKRDILNVWVDRSVKPKIMPATFQSEIARLLTKKKSRISVGYSKIDGEFILELRTYTNNQRAVGVVEEIKELVNGQANIEIYTNIKTVSGNIGLNLTSRCRPLCLGASIGHSDGGAGSVGGFIDKDGDIGLISCSHVLAPLDRNSVSKGDRIYQPGRILGSPIKGADSIAQLENWVVISQSQTNETDSGYALFIDDNVDIYAPNGRIGNYIPINTPNCPFEGEKILRLPETDIEDDDRFPINTEVHKIGFKTGFTTGRLRALSIDTLPVNGLYHFNNVIQIDWLSPREPFSDAGDSGSLVFTSHENGNLYGLGIVFATGYSEVPGNPGGAKRVSFACDLNDTLKYFDVDWLE